MTAVIASVDDPGRVHVLEIEVDDLKFQVHLAVLQTRLHTFAAMAVAPSSGTLLTSAFECVCATAISCAMPVVFPGKAVSEISFGETLWLSMRQQIDWRVIRRIEITEDGTVRKKGWLPRNIAEPLLRLLESSVPVLDPYLLDGDASGSCTK